jgi:hypothetical protein
MLSEDNTEHKLQNKMNACLDRRLKNPGFEFPGCGRDRYRVD